MIKLPRIARPIPFFLASFGLTLAVLASVQGTRSVPLPPVEEAIQFASLETAPYSKAAAAFRAGDFPAAQTELEHLANTGSLQAHVILGLYAHSTDRDALALEQLRAAEDYRGEFADWRLWALAESAETLGQSPLSLAVLWRLVEEHPDSPLRSRAVEILASRAAAQSDWLEALTISQNLYGPRLDSQARERLARIAWQASKELDDLEVQQAAARRLLVDHPLMAPELDVVELFREPEGGVPWPEFLSVRELVRRSESLLNADLQDSALETLAEVPESARGIDWHLIQARSLTAAHRGNEALSALESAVSPVPTRANQIEWERARAALEYSTPRRGRGEVTAEQRGEMRQRAHQHLRNVVEGSDEDLAVRALKLLFADLMEDERFDEAISILNRLKGFNPRDTTGARTLWGHGWKEFSERNYSGAVGYWTELGQLYPQSNYNRSGLYWSARSHEKLGNPGRAQELLHQVADVDFTDFYRRHALTRLETKAGVRDTDQEQPTEPWPVDPALARAESLYQLGLDDAALLELEATLESAGHRAAQALKARILAASGSRRQSILALRQAFPILGTPHQGLAPSEARRLYYPLDFQDVIEEHSKSRHLPSHLIFGMIRQESAFDASAKSWAGAQGLMQIMPATGRELARRLGLHYSRERLSDPEFSIQLGTLYFQQVLNMFSGDEVLALAGYNAGPYRIKRLWRQAGTDAEIDQFLEQLSYSETRNYVKRVLLYSDSYRRLYDSSG